MALTLRKRVTGLERVDRLIDRIADRIRYTGAPLESVFRSLSQDEELGTLALFSGRIPGESCRFSGLEKVDEDLLRDFYSKLGSSDINGEIRHCREYRLLFQERLEEARKRYREKGRLYLTLGGCSGLMAALLLV